MKNMNAFYAVKTLMASEKDTANYFLPVVFDDKYSKDAFKREFLPLPQFRGHISSETIGNRSLLISFETEELSFRFINNLSTAISAYRVALLERRTYSEDGREKDAKFDPSWLERKDSYLGVKRYSQKHFEARSQALQYIEDDSPSEKGRLQSESLWMSQNFSIEEWKKEMTATLTSTLELNVEASLISETVASFCEKVTLHGASAFGITAGDAAIYLFDYHALRQSGDNTIGGMLSVKKPNWSYDVALEKSQDVLFDALNSFDDLAKKVVDDLSLVAEHKLNNDDFGNVINGACRSTFDSRHYGIFSAKQFSPQACELTGETVAFKLSYFLIRDLYRCLGYRFKSNMQKEVLEISKSQDKILEAIRNENFWDQLIANNFDKARKGFFNL